MKKNQMQKKQSNLPVQDTVIQKRSNLEKILPKGNKGNAIFSIQMGEFCISIPVPLPQKMKEILAQSKTKSRTVTDYGDFKIGLDII